MYRIDSDCMVNTLGLLTDIGGRDQRGVASVVDLRRGLRGMNLELSNEVRQCTNIHMMTTSLTAGLRSHSLP